MENKSDYGSLLLRIGLGLLFLIPGLGKLMNPSMPIVMLKSLGFPAPLLFGWLLLAVEIVCGLALLAGWQTKWAVWPLVAVMLVAICLVVVPSMNGNPVNLLFHLLAVLGLVSLFLTGPGAYSLDSRA